MCSRLLCCCVFARRTGIGAILRIPGECPLKVPPTCRAASGFAFPSTAYKRQVQDPGSRYAPSLLVPFPSVSGRKTDESPTSQSLVDSTASRCVQRSARSGSNIGACVWRIGPFLVWDSQALSTLSFHGHALCFFFCGRRGRGWQCDWMIFPWSARATSRLFASALWLAATSLIQR